MIFSVIIPVYNRTTTLKSAIESVLSQTHKSYELIVVDDGSDDSVRQSLRPYFNRIRYIRIPENMGVSSARNLGIRRAKGDFIAFLDSDDIWLPDKLKTQLKAMKESKSLVSHTNEFWYRGDKFINQGKKHERYGGQIFDKVLDFCRISPSSVVLHRDVFFECGFFDEGMRVCEDYDLWLRVCARYPVCYIPEKLIIKRAITDDQLSDSITNIESIRLISLARFIRCKSLPPSQKLAAVKELARKYDIICGAINNKF